VDLDTDKLISQYETYVKILKRFFPDEGIDRLLDTYGTRLVTAPRGLIKEEGGQHGALVEFLCNVNLKVKDLSQGVCDQESAVRVALVHELGKLGDLGQDLFLEQDSSWHREKLGQNFKYNEKCNKMSVSHRTLFILQHFNIELTQDEWISILVSQGMQYPENAFYGKTKPLLSSVLDFARSLQ
jgi:hypothetical protein